MIRTLGKKDEISRTDYLLFPIDFYESLPLQDKYCLFFICMAVRICLTSIFNLPQDNFHAVRPLGAGT